MTVAATVWPSREDYQSAVRDPRRNLRDPRLQLCRVETRALVGAVQIPFPRSGNFGAVYKFTDGTQTYALKVFDKILPDRQQRYRLIHDHLAALAALRQLVGFRYDEQGICVRGNWYPTLIMEWAEGRPLDQHLQDVFSSGGTVDNSALCRSWVKLVIGLQTRCVAHGDLQHGNILVMPNNRFKLVDYDGMFVPAMRQAGLTAVELGLPAYQHPQRHRDFFDERLDDFAALVILLTLACVDAALWQQFHTDDNALLIQAADLARPEESTLWRALAKSPAARLRRLAAIVQEAARGEVEKTPQFVRVVSDPAVRKLLEGPGWRPPPLVLPPPRPAQRRRRIVATAPPPSTWSLNPETRPSHRIGKWKYVAAGIAVVGFLLMLAGWLLLR